MRFVALVALVVAALAAAPQAKADDCYCHIYIVFMVDINSITVTPYFVLQMRTFMHASLSAAIKQANCDDVRVAIVEVGVGAQVVAWINQDPNASIDGYTPNGPDGTVANFGAVMQAISTASVSLQGDSVVNGIAISGNNVGDDKTYGGCSSVPFRCTQADVLNAGGQLYISTQIMIQMQAGLYVFCPGVTTTTTTTTTTLPDIQTPLPPADVCFQCRMRRNHKDLYPDETDCHYYYQCFYFNSTYAVGFRRKCADGLFWHDPVLSCMPEGEVPCVDRCLTEDATAAKGCYAGSGCRQFFACANTGSYGMCCPLGTEFNENTCGCDQSDTCDDFCEQTAPLVPTTVGPVTQVNATVCIDAFGSAISIVPGEPNAYILIAEDGSPTVKKYCPPPLLFELATCRCNIEGAGTTPVPTPERKALLYLNFDNTLKDQSVHNFEAFLYDNAELDLTNSAVGSGSLSVTAGHVEIPGLKTFDFRKSGSWCAFYRGNAVGGILGNNKDAASSEYTTVFGTQPSSSFIGKFKFWQPIGQQSVQNAFTTPVSGWNHFCATYDGNAIRLYLNGANVQTQFIGGYLSVAHCPYTVGHDQQLGYFEGNIDEVMMTSFAMTVDEINAHRTGNLAFLQAQGFFG